MSEPARENESPQESTEATQTQTRSFSSIPYTLNPKPKALNPSFEGLGFWSSVASRGLLEGILAGLLYMPLRFSVFWQAPLNKGFRV